MAKFLQKQEDGTEIEVEGFTQEELDAKITAKETEFQGKITNLEKDKLALEDQVKNVKPDHPNFAALKTALKEKEDALTAIKTERETEKQQRDAEKLDTEIKTISRGNEELSKKIKLHLTSTLKGMPTDTPEAREAQMTAALKLSADSPEEFKGMFDGGIGGGGPGAGNGAGGEEKQTVEFTAKEKALGAKMGISAEDYKKYGPRLGKK